jgi:hypothetical protein
VSLLQQSGFVSRAYKAESWFGEGYYEPRQYLEDENAQNISIVKAVICAGLFPHVVEAKVYPSGGIGVRTPSISGSSNSNKDIGSMSLHPSSAIRNIRTLDYPFLVYQSRMMTKKLFIHDVTSVKKKTKNHPCFAFIDFQFVLL